MAVACQDDVETTLYQVFDSGRYVILVDKTREHIRVPEQGPINVSVNGERLPWACPVFLDTDFL